MEIKLELLYCFKFFLLAAALSFYACPARSDNGTTTSLSQKEILKNWTLSVCLAEISKSEANRADANAAASAYMEAGRQPIEKYAPLRELVKEFTSKNYSGSIKSDFDTMKCIDLFNSKTLYSTVRRIILQK